MSGCPHTNNAADEKLGQNFPSYLLQTVLAGFAPLFPSLPRASSEKYTLKQSACNRFKFGEFFDVG